MIIVHIFIMHLYLFNFPIQNRTEISIKIDDIIIDNKNEKPDIYIHLS